MMGVDAIAAVSVFFPILFFLLAFVIGISAGTTVLIGQAWGAQNLEKVRSVIGSTLFMTLIGGSIIAILGWGFAEHILRLLGTDPKSCTFLCPMFDGCWWVVHYCLSILFTLQFYVV